MTDCINLQLVTYWHDSNCFGCLGDMLLQPALERGNCACNFPSRRQQYLAGSKVPGNLVNLCFDMRYQEHPLDLCTLFGGGLDTARGRTRSNGLAEFCKRKSARVAWVTIVLPHVFLYSIPPSGVCPGPNRYGVSPKWLASLCSLYMAPSSPAHLPVWGFLSISLISSLCHRGHPRGFVGRPSCPSLPPLPLCIIPRPSPSSSDLHRTILSPPSSTTPNPWTSLAKFTLFTPYCDQSV